MPPAESGRSFMGTVASGRAPSGHAQNSRGRWLPLLVGYEGILRLYSNLGYLGGRRRQRARPLKVSNRTRHCASRSRRAHASFRGLAEGRRVMVSKTLSLLAPALKSWAALAVSPGRDAP